jgi:hypothetical protein
VAATAVDRKAPTRFSSADSATAVRGLSAPLAIEHQSGEDDDAQQEKL